ncbi:tetratricopeptide repeat protein [Hahella ganghwensis]|uniref:tetratricopeptide repeat protein n=1 Tax=Hahella ganghwensis TaxID=286420 RepID=UPI0003A62AF5|nr:tetratricopeptide repeat protein [Hahella ganghwensis]
MEYFNYLRFAGVVCLVVISGCAGMGTMPAFNQTPVSASTSTGTIESKTSTDKRRFESSQDSQDFLPQQAYSSDGRKITYKAAPNPYLQQSVQIPDAARKAFMKANSALKNERYREARRGFREITRTYPELSGPWVKLGEVADIRGDKEKAESHFRKALSVNPSNVNGYIALALHLRRKGDFAGALQVYVSALSVWKDFPDAHLNLAILYDLYLNQPELAQPHYEAYDFLVGGKHPEVKDWLAEIRRRTGIEKSFIDNPPAPAAESEVVSGEADTQPTIEEKG